MEDHQSAIDIVIANPPYSLEEDFGSLDFVGRYGLPLNLLYLASSLKERGLQSEIVDLSYRSRDLETCAEHLLSFNSEFIGIAVHFTFLANKSLQLISLLKKKRPEVKIVVGGAHFTAVPEETMQRCAEIDVGILGEGEQALIQVIEKMREGAALSDISGLIFYEEGSLIKTGGPVLVEDLDELPPPNFNLVDLDFYSPAFHKESGDVNLVLSTSRGCPFKCTFCDRTTLGNTMRFHSIEYLSKLIDMLYEKHGVRCIELGDENICLNQKRLKELCAMFKEKYEAYGLTWSAAMRADGVRPHTGKMMYEAGCRSVFFGLESASQRMLDFYEKGFQIKSVPEKCHILREAGISLSGSFIIGGPTETEASIQETLDFVKRVNFDYLFLWYFTILPGAVARCGIENHGTLIGDYSHRTAQHISFLPHGMQKETLEKAYKQIYRAFYSKPSTVIRIVQRYGFAGAPQLVHNGFKYLYRFVLS